MVAIRAQAILHTVDNVAANYITNAFAFEVDGTVGAPANLTPLIKGFYDDVVTLLSPVLSQTGHEIKYTLLPGAAPNYPFDTDTFAFVSAPSGTALPDELAICCSFQGSKNAGSPQARRRGRVYLGPLKTSALTANRPSAAALSLVAAAATDLLSGVGAIGGVYAWGVWSQTDGALVPITDGWVDNACDIQRRRGVVPTVRTTWT